MRIGPWMIGQWLVAIGQQAFLPSLSEDGAVIMLGGGNYPHGQMGPPGCGRAD